MLDRVFSEDSRRQTIPTRVTVTGIGDAALVVAPEVAARIVARRVAGEPLSAITASLHMTPAEVRAVLGARPVVAAQVRVLRGGLAEALVTAIRAGAEVTS
jgi:hypothetical protein